MTIASRSQPPWIAMAALAAALSLAPAAPTVAHPRVIRLEAARIDGDLMVPPAIADARPWPDGMVMTPPATGDLGIWLGPDLPRLLSRLIRLLDPAQC